MSAVVGPGHCERHRAHQIGCLDCAAEVSASAGLDLCDFLDLMDDIGWVKGEHRVADSARRPTPQERTEAVRSIMLVAELSEEMAEAVLCDLIFLGWSVEPAPTNGRSDRG